MGYRSDVAICVTNEDYQKLCEKMQANGVFEFLHRAKLYEKGKYIILKWDWVKWYEDYPEIQTIESFLESCEEARLVLIGEDYSDIEIIDYGDGDLCEQLDVSREIAIFEG